MPDKAARHGRGKRSVRSKGRRSGRTSLPVAERQSQVSQVTGSVSRPKASVPALSAATSIAETRKRYAYVPYEMRTIGILSGIVIVILVVLALVLS
jgi:hypothetical protein